MGPHQPKPARILAATLFCCAFAIGVGGVAVADSPDARPPPPANVTVVANADGSHTVTLSGTWEWPTHGHDCNNDKRAVGWAVDWNDTVQPGNLLATLRGVPYDVGAASANAFNPADNAVHYVAGPGGCGVFGDHSAPETVGHYNTGPWGPISHTYDPSQTTFSPCVITYDVHLDSNGGAPKNAGQVQAGGTGHNHDNSVQSNGHTPAGNRCLATSLSAPSPTVQVPFFPSMSALFMGVAGALGGAMFILRRA